MQCYYFYPIFSFHTLVLIFQKCPLRFQLSYIPQIFPCPVIQSCPTLCDTKDCSLPGSSVHGDFPGRNTKWVAMLSSRRSSQHRDRSRSPTLQADSLLPEPPRQTGVNAPSQREHGCPMSHWESKRVLMMMKVFSAY